MKYLGRIIAGLVVGMATASMAQSNAITGKLNILYNSRMTAEEEGRLKKGVKDLYVLNLTVGDVLLISGKMEHLPTIFSQTLGLVDQDSILVYDLGLLLINPEKKADVRLVSRLGGTVPIDKDGVYDFNEKLAIKATSTFSSVVPLSLFKGRALGIRPASASLIDKAKEKAEAYVESKRVQSEGLKAIRVKKDLMVFTNDFELAGGPVDTYPAVVVQGAMVFDYEKSAWSLAGLTLSYRQGEERVIDKLSGSIRWIEDPNRKVNGKGWYEYDVRINEPEKAADSGGGEEALFATNPMSRSLTGKVKYVDSFKGDAVVSSRVEIDLSSNNLSQAQRVNLAKLFFCVSVVPFSAE